MEKTRKIVSCYLATDSRGIGRYQSQAPLQQLNGEATFCVNSGTTSNDGRVFLPIDDWSHPEQILYGAPAPLSSSVTTLDLGTELGQAFRLKLPNLLDVECTSKEDRSSILTEMAKEVCAGAKQVGLLANEILASNIAVNPPGAPSTGRDFENNVYVGLHIDDHDKLALDKRSDAVQLLAMNCSAAARHFHYIDAHVDELMSLCDGTPDLLADRVPGEVSPSELLKNRFLQRFPNRPVVRVILPPGHAYLVTPQNIIHDGAAGSYTAVDVAFLLLGRFTKISSS